MMVKKVPAYENGQIKPWYCNVLTYGVSAPMLIAEPEDIAIPQAVATRKFRLSLVECERDSDTYFINQREDMHYKQLLTERLAKNQLLGRGANKKVVDILDGKTHQVMVGNTERTRCIW